MFSSSTRRALLGALLRSAAWSTFALVLSLPLVRLIHDHFGLGVPPFNGVVMLGCGVVAAFLGASIGGVLVGIFAGQARGPVSLWAAFGGLVWGLGVVMWLVPTYGALVVDDIARQGASMVLQDGSNLVPRGQSAVEAFRQGQRKRAAQTVVAPYVDEAEDAAGKGLAKLPALSILGWALVGPPLLAAWECRGVRRR